MKTYHSLSKIRFLKKYSYKFLFIAFIGIHVPLLGILFYTIFVSDVSIITVISVVLVLTLIATFLTLLFLNNLLLPIIQGKIALRNFIDHNTIPQLPIHYNDEVGEVLKNIQFTIENLYLVNKEKEDLTEMLSHDLKTPIHQLLNVIDFLKEEGENPARRSEHIDTLEKIVHQQQDFLDRMLHILKSKNIEINPSNFESLNIADLVAKVISKHQASIDSKKLRIRNSIPADLVIMGHDIALEEVFSNLLSNAVKFSQVKGEIIFTGKSDNKMAIVEICDFGLGFSKETKDTMFRKFILGQVGTDGETSTGLGLYLVKNIVQKHGGSIYVHSDGINKGAVVTVNLPIQK